MNLILNYIISVILAIFFLGVCWSIKDFIKNKIISRHIIEDINATFFDGVFSCGYNVDRILEAYNYNYASVIRKKLFKYKPIFKPEYEKNIIAKKSNYIYAVIGALSVQNHETFKYDLFEYCEKHLINNNNFFRKNIFASLTNIVKKNYRYRNSDPYYKILQVLCENYVTIDFDKPLHEILTYINQSRNKAKSIVSEYDKQYVDEMYDMYISEIEEKIR